MGKIRDFVSEDHLPKDYLIEQYGDFYQVATRDITPKLTFEEFYNMWCRGKDQHVYKGMKNES